MPDDIGKYFIGNADQGINTGAHPANIPEKQIIDAKNMFVRGRGRIQQVRFPTPFSTGNPVLDQLVSPTYTDITNVSGLQDAVFSGQYDETQPTTTLKVKVQITATGASDTIEWYYDTGGGYGAAIGTSPILGGGNPISSTGITVTFGATTGHTLNDYWEFYAVPILVTNGSATVTSLLDLTDATYVTHPLKAGCGFYYKDGAAYADDFSWYRILAVASDGLSFTLDRNFEYQTQGLTQRLALQQEHFFTYPVTAVINYENTNDEETTLATAGKYLRRWNGAAWETEYTLASWNERGMFLDYRGQCLFTNGVDEILRSYTGDGDWDALGDPVIEEITVQHTESGYHNGVTEFTFVNGNSIDDAIFGGAYTGSPQAAGVEEEVKVKVVIDGTAPDTFEWFLDVGDGGDYASQASGVACATTDTALGATGITVKFGVTTGHQSGDQWEFYIVYDLTTYNIKIKDCIQTPTKALVLTGTIEEYDIGNGKDVVAAMIMRSLNKGQAWTVIEQRYRPWEVQNPGGHGTTTVGGLYIREGGSILTSIATVGEFYSNYRDNALPRIGQFCYILESPDDGVSFDAIAALTGGLSDAQKNAGGVAPKSNPQQTIAEWATTNAGVLEIAPFSGWDGALVDDVGDSVNSIPRPPNAFDQFSEATTLEYGTTVTMAGTRDFYGGANDYTEYAYGTFLVYPKDLTGLNFGYAFSLETLVAQHIGRPLLYGPMAAYDDNAGEQRHNIATIVLTQGNDALGNTADRKAYAKAFKDIIHTIGITQFADDIVNFTYGNSGVTPRGFLYFSTDGTQSLISRDTGVLGELRNWGGWWPLGDHGEATGPFVFWTNQSNNFYYALSRKDLGGGVRRLVLSISDDEGDSFTPVWQDTENNVAGNPPRRVHHWSENEFIVITEDVPYIYRCRYHVNAPKAKNIMVWRQRLLAYGDLLDLASPRGATPDNGSFPTPTYKLKYEGMDWADDQLIGHRLYPDVAGLPGTYYVVIGNTNNEVEVAEDLSSIASSTKVFEIREYAPHRMRISGVNRFDYWDLEDAQDEDDKIRAIRPYLQTNFETPQSGILVLMEEGHALYLGNDPNSWIKYSGKTDRGCIGNYAIAENMTLSHDALSVISNGTPTPLAGRLDTTPLQESSPSLFIETLNEDYKDEAMGFLGKGLEFLCVPTVDSPWLDQAIVLDLLRGGFWRIDFPTYGGYYVFLSKSNTAPTYPLPVSAFSDKSGYVIYAGCVSGSVWKLFDSKTGGGIGDEVDTKVDLTVQLNAGAPEDWFGIHKIAFMMYTASGGTLSYRFNPNMAGWTAFDTKTLSAGMNRVIITAPQPMEGNTIALNLKFNDSGHVEIDLPIEFSAQLKHSGIEEG